MSVIGSEILAGASGNSGYNIDRSLRFRSSASAYLSRTPASAGNLKTWTWSAWVKRGTLGGTICLVGGGTGGSSESMIMLDADCLRLYNINGAQDMNLVTTAVYRDPSAWYHFVVIYDAAQATSTNRASIYVNGVQVTSFSTAQYPASTSQITIFNGAVSSYIGLRGWATDLKFDGYLAEVNFIDGQALTPSSFGQTDAVTGVWAPKKYTGTYGTNGFYLPFSDNTSATTLAYDKSGNGNNWTPNNISTTAGSTYDSMTDVPTLTSATAANFAVWNPICTPEPGYTGGRAPTSNGNLTAGGGATQAITATMSSRSGKFYAEFVVANTWTDNWFGISNSRQSLAIVYNAAGSIGGNSGGYTTHATYTNGDVIGIAVDVDNQQVSFYKNNAFQATKAFSVGPLTVDEWYYGYYTSNGSNATANFGQRPFAYTPPTGFKALNTFNLPDPTIKKPNQYMDVLTWTGDGTSSRAITGLNFQPDLVWDKMRSGAYQHAIVDAVRGGNQVLHSNSTSAEDTNWQYGYVSSFNSNGFTIQAGSTSAENWNLNGSTFVAWNWKESATAGFDIVTYTGTGVARTVSHSLGVAPKMIIVKKRSATGGWPVYFETLGPTNYLYLHGTNASTNTATLWNNTAPTSSVFTVGTDDWSNGNGATFVAYLFSEIPGFSKFGSYTGNGSADGPFVYCGFRPKYVMVKRTDTTSDWGIYDSARDTYNQMTDFLFPNGSYAETAGYPVDFLSNGFKSRNSAGFPNANGGTYIFCAFAENPFKYSNAR